MGSRETPHRSIQIGPPEAGDEWRLRVEGLVARTLSLRAEELVALPDAVTVVGGPRCPQGFGTSGGTYTGPSLLALIEAAGPLGSATHASVQAGEYVASFSLESLGRRGAILATERDGARLEWKTGGPVRLVPSQGACFDSVKWVERIWLDADASRATALALVKARRRPA